MPTSYACFASASRSSFEAAEPCSASGATRSSSFRERPTSLRAFCRSSWAASSSSGSMIDQPLARLHRVAGSREDSDDTTGHSSGDEGMLPPRHRDDRREDDALLDIAYTGRRRLDAEQPGRLGTQRDAAVFDVDLDAARRQRGVSFVGPDPRRSDGERDRDRRGRRADEGAVASQLPHRCSPDAVTSVRPWSACRAGPASCRDRRGPAFGSPCSRRTRSAPSRRA